MIKTESRLKVCDNSGALVVSTIRILGGGTTGRVGDVIVVAVKKAQTQSTAINKPSSSTKNIIKKGEVHKLLIVRTKKEMSRPNGVSIAFEDNCGVILNDKGEPVATRIFGPIPKELRARKFLKVVSLASFII